MPVWASPSRGGCVAFACKSGTGQWDTNGTVFIILNAKDIINYEKIDWRLTNLNRWILFVFL